MAPLHWITVCVCVAAADLSVWQELASCSYDDTIRLWESDGEDWTCRDTLAAHTSTVWAIAFNRAGTQLGTVAGLWRALTGSAVSAGDDKTLIVWQWVTDGRPRWRNAAQITGQHKRTIFTVDCDPDGRLIATGAGDNALRVFVCGAAEGGAVTVGQLLAVPDAHAADVNCVRWNWARPELLASCGDDNVVKIWRISE